MLMGCFYIHPYCLVLYPYYKVYKMDYRVDFINSSAWGLRCSFYGIGQCEGLKMWNEWQ